MSEGTGTGPRVAVVDVGSNSIRLVVFSAASRALLPVFNEKVLCGLGRGLPQSGRLNPDGVALALQNVERFVAIAETMGAADLRAFATAAVRDAEDGAAFLNLIRARCGLDVRLLSGDEEARLSALGVVSSIPGADGIVGDLGGGSLELISVEAEAVREHATLPLGPFRMPDNLRHEDLVRLVDDQLWGLPWLEGGQGKTLYPVGGSWRSIAKVHMNHVRYPLSVIHHYSIDAGAAEDFTAVVARLSGGSLRRLKGVSRRRLEGLPHGALVLSRLIARARPKSVVFSSYGLREGLVFDTLPPEKRALDPLVEAAREMALRGARFQPDGTALMAWLQPLLPDSAAVRRLALAACWLGDICGLDHPDYRGEHAFHRVLRIPAVGIDHGDRSQLALALLARYEGTIEAACADDARKLLNENDLVVARVIGLALRLAFAIGAGSVQRVCATELSLTPDNVLLRIPASGVGFSGEIVSRRLDALARALGRVGDVRTFG